MASSTSISFKVTRREPELIAPAKPTPRQYKFLSEIDNHEILRYQIPIIQFYQKKSSPAKDPVEVIREAIAKTLVYYYPFAGRLREGPGRKLGVDCTGEGVMFIEADADVRIEDFGDIIHPPFPCLEELIYNVPGSEGIFNSPLLLIQVTRMKCGGFIFANRLNHTMSDAFGLAQFLNAIAEIARGESSPSVPPIWRREFVKAADPQHATYKHHAYDEVPDTNGDTHIPLDDIVYRSFIFSPTEIAAIRSSLPPSRGRPPSTFEILTACLWRCRTIALMLDPEVEIHMLFAVNARGNSHLSPLFSGYYGNAHTLAAAISPAGKLCQNPLGYALELVMKANDDITVENVRSLTNFLVIKRMPAFPLLGIFMLSDVTKVGFGDVDFGWGKPVYGGPVGCAIEGSFFIPLTNAEGERETLLPLCLPRQAMEKFVVELGTLLQSCQPVPGFSISLIKSAL